MGCAGRKPRFLPVWPACSTKGLSAGASVPSPLTSMRMTVPSTVPRLAVAETIVGCAAVPQASIEIAIGPKGDHAAVVVSGRLRSGQQDRFAGRGQPCCGQRWAASALTTVSPFLSV